MGNHRITISGIIREAYLKIPRLKEEASFVKYCGDLCVDIWTEDNTRYRYSYNHHRCIDVEDDSYFMDRYDSKLIPVQESTYYSNFAELVRGRMDARLISRKDLCEKTGIDESSFYRYITCTRKPNAYAHYILKWYLEGIHPDSWKLP